MKISKLFHWLYAFLMFMPILALIPSVAYFAFNQKSENYTYQTVTETYEYKTNEVNSASDLVIGNIYHFELNNYQIESDKYFSIDHLGVYNIVYDNNISFIATTLNQARLQVYNGLFTYTLFDTIISNSYPGFRTTTSNIVLSFECDFVYSNYNTNITNLIEYISASHYLGEKSVTITESEQSPMNIFYSSVDKLFNMPIFAWAKTSFLVTPFTYIGNLFGLQATSPVIYMLSYWLAISIVWLVFDLIMYVPLLVHRWIDKGIIE